VNRLIDWSFDHARTILIAFLLILTAGSIAYVSIPKESSPEIKIPTLYVSVAYEGISPDDAERLLVRPLETQLQSLAGLKQLRASAAEGYANVTLEFEAGIDPKARSTTCATRSTWPRATCRPVRRTR
jgi:multidrug efflux pump